LGTKAYKRSFLKLCEVMEIELIGGKRVILETLVNRRQSEDIRQASLKEMDSLEESGVENG
jgi:hypothetical protein